MDEVAADGDPQQPPTFVVIDLTNSCALCHPHNLTAHGRPSDHPGGTSHHNRANVA